MRDTTLSALDRPDRGVIFRVGYITLALIPFDHDLLSPMTVVELYLVWITFFCYLIWVSRLCVKDLKRRQVAVQAQTQGGAQALAR